MGKHSQNPSQFESPIFAKMRSLKSWKDLWLMFVRRIAAFKERAPLKFKFCSINALQTIQIVKTVAEA
jgi:hypothetical protein